MRKSLRAMGIIIIGMTMCAFVPVGFLYKAALIGFEFGSDYVEKMGQKCAEDLAKKKP